MNRTTLAGTVLVLASFVHAQTTFPLGFETTDGGSYSSYLGRYPGGRFQQICGGLQGSNKKQTWKSCALRRSNATTSTNYGRSWTNVTLSISDCDFTKLSDTWTRNQLSTPTVVFSVTMKWPDTSGAPSSKPATWGLFAAKDDMLFPFTTPYAHSGVWGTTFDWVFQGGALANNVAWASTSARSYYTDGIANGNQSAGGSYTILPTVSGCRAAYFVNWLFSDHKVVGGAQHRTQPFAGGALASTLHIGVIGIENGSTTGVPLGGSCHPLYLDMSKPYVVFPFTTDSTGAFITNFLTTRFVKSAVGLNVWSQAAYSDSGLFQLTRGGYAPIAALPTATPVKFAQHLYQYDSTSMYGFGPVGTLVPILYVQ